MVWIASNKYLGLADMQNNAKIIKDYFTDKDYTLNAISAMLGNMAIKLPFKSYCSTGRGLLAFGFCIFINSFFTKKDNTK